MPHESKPSSSFKLKKTLKFQKQPWNVDRLKTTKLRPRSDIPLLFQNVPSVQASVRQKGPRSWNSVFLDRVPEHLCICITQMVCLHQHFVSRRPFSHFHLRLKPHSNECLHMRFSASYKGTKNSQNIHFRRQFNYFEFFLVSHTLIFI